MGKHIVNERLKELYVEERSKLSAEPNSDSFLLHLKRLGKDMRRKKK